MTVWQSFFGWPDGGVWSNLIASAVWVAPGFVVHHRLMRRHTTREIERQTAQLKAHIDATIGSAR